MNSFEDFVKLHLNAIEERNIKAFAEFLHPSQNSIIIFPNGDIIEGYENILNFHKEWFTDIDWRMDVDIIDIFTADNIGYALLDVAYHDLDEDRNPYELKYLLSLLFKKVEDKWILFRDQNTLK
ncbi:MAG: nuclear transport factor 2 family protein [Defluviitaleaceae bacterium]|nr:nuclear transport factor 2 family protein [Defluviitaleaceae bacterium]